MEVAAPKQVGQKSPSKTWCVLCLHNEGESHAYVVHGRSWYLAVFGLVVLVFHQEPCSALARALSELDASRFFDKCQKSVSVEVVDGVKIGVKISAHQF